MGIGVAYVTSHSGPAGVMVRIALPQPDTEADVRLDVVGRFLHIELVRAHADRTEMVSQRVTLPPGITERDLAVSCADGVLEVRVPPRPPTRATQ